MTVVDGKLTYRDEFPIVLAVGQRLGQARRVLMDKRHPTRHRNAVILCGTKRNSDLRVFQDQMVGLRYARDDGDRP